MFTFFKNPDFLPLEIIRCSSYEVAISTFLLILAICNFSGYVNPWFWESEVCVCVCVYMLSRFSCVWLFVTPWTVARQSPVSMGFSRQEYWCVLPLPPPGNLPNPGIEPTFPVSPTLAYGFFTLVPPGKPICMYMSVCFFLGFFFFPVRNIHSSKQEFIKFLVWTQTELSKKTTWFLLSRCLWSN